MAKYVIKKEWNATWEMFIWAAFQKWNDAEDEYICSGDTLGECERRLEIALGRPKPEIVKELEIP